MYDITKNKQELAFCSIFLTTVISQIESLEFSALYKKLNDLCCYVEDLHENFEDKMRMSVEEKKDLFEELTSEDEKMETQTRLHFLCTELSDAIIDEADFNSDVQCDNSLLILKKIIENYNESYKVLVHRLEAELTQLPEDCSAMEESTDLRMI